MGYRYDSWLLKELRKNHEGFSACSFPIFGWLLAIIMFSFIFPLSYVFKNYKTKGQRIRNLENKFASLGDSVK